MKFFIFGAWNFFSYRFLPIFPKVEYAWNTIEWKIYHEFAVLPNVFLNLTCNLSVWFLSLDAIYHEDTFHSASDDHISSSSFQWEEHWRVDWLKKKQQWWTSIERAQWPDLESIWPYPFILKSAWVMIHFTMLFIEFPLVQELLVYSWMFLA